MKIVVGIAALMVIHMISVIYHRKCDDNMGYHIGKKHMRETWGIDERKEYHE